MSNLKQVRKKQEAVATSPPHSLCGVNGWLWAAVVVLVVVAAVVWVGCHHRGRVAKNVGMLAP
ncbi:MAG: hypothetical protein FWD53_07695, partial [Phycisphaerales bacterium]|nr:hypothetical protein [Phycisphaerales bacterium]